MHPHSSTRATRLVIMVPQGILPCAIVLLICSAIAISTGCLAYQELVVVDAEAEAKSRDQARAERGHPRVHSRLRWQRRAGTGSGKADGDGRGGWSGRQQRDGKWPGRRRGATSATPEAAAAGASLFSPKIQTVLAELFCG